MAELLEFTPLLAAGESSHASRSYPRLNGELMFARLAEVKCYIAVCLTLIVCLSVTS